MGPAAAHGVPALACKAHAAATIGVASLAPPTAILSFSMVCRRSLARRTQLRRLGWRAWHPLRRFFPSPWCAGARLQGARSCDDWGGELGTPYGDSFLLHGVPALACKAHAAATIGVASLAP